MKHVVQVGVAKSFLESAARLTRSMQKKVYETLEAYRQNPTGSGLNFEKINAADDKVRSLRVGIAYRMILVQPPKGGVVVAVWIDHHDEAYRWAARKTFGVNPVSGTFQVFSEEEGAEALAKAQGESDAEAYELQPLFGHVDDEDMLLAGIPLPLLASVRSVRTEFELDALAPHLPADAADVLYMLAAGTSFYDALEEASRPKERIADVDTEDVAAALARPTSQESFRLVDGEHELEEMLGAPLALWRTFLHPSQRRIVEWRTKGPIRVLGGAGTGKTVVLIHRARFLAREVFTGGEDRLLVTTYTKNLASDIEGALGQLFDLDGPSAAAARTRIDVVNIHALARRMYEEQLGAKVNVLDDDKVRRNLMEECAGDDAGHERPTAFYIEEWEQVVQAQGVGSLPDYLRARRNGRGTPLGRAQRAAVWRVFEAYREALATRGLVEWGDVLREVRLGLEHGKIRSPYVAVLADEVQDLSAAELTLLRALAPPGPCDMFLVGDAHQRIYGQMASLGRAGIEIRGRSRRLRINYRTTDEIRVRAVAILEGVEVDDLDEGTDSFEGYRSLRSGPAPEVVLCEHADEEERAIVERIEAWRAAGVPYEEICVSARTSASVERYASALKDAGIPTRTIKGTTATSGKGVRMATMHRMKGLEFPRVILAGVQEGELPFALPVDAFGDAASESDHEKRERCLFYVAATRARDVLVITGFGRPSPWLG